MYISMVCIIALFGIGSSSTFNKRLIIYTCLQLQIGVDVTKFNGRCSLCNWCDFINVELFISASISMWFSEKCVHLYIM